MKTFEIMGNNYHTNRDDFVMKKFESMGNSYHTNRDDFVMKKFESMGNSYHTNRDDLTAFYALMLFLSKIVNLYP